MTLKKAFVKMLHDAERRSRLAAGGSLAAYTSLRRMMIRRTLSGRFGFRLGLIA